MFMLGTGVFIFVIMQMRRAFRAVKAPGEETGQDVLDIKPKADAQLNPKTSKEERKAFNEAYETWLTAERAKEKLRRSPLNRMTRAQASTRGTVYSAAVQKREKGKSYAF